MIRVFTIGFASKTAEQFFSRLKQPGLIRLIDVRLHNISQLSGFTKKNDLKYFARSICDLDYVHLLELAPTQELLDAYRKKGDDWEGYEKTFRSLVATRRIEDTIDKKLIRGGCLLCSEASPERCHRRLVAEYLRDKWGNVQIVHL